MTSAQQQFDHNSDDLLNKSIKQAFLSVASELAAVEDRIKDSLSSEAETLTEISSYLQSLGGKRVRPFLTILSANFIRSKAPAETLIDMAATVELIHMATLLHDDIIDQSSTRRGKPSAYVEYGLCDTLLTGDFLLVKAFGICARLDPFLIESTEKACIELTEGEVLEGTLKENRRVSFEQYVDIVAKKTASLFALSAGAGAYIAEANKEDIHSMTQFGLNAGIAFQMIDDILDVVADEDLLGKPSGTDLRQKTPSLINILWLESGSNLALDYFSNSASDEKLYSRALKDLKSSSVINDAREIAARKAEEARINLESVVSGDPEIGVQLQALLEYTLRRCL